jgi:mRNA interferase ChpB
MIPNKGDILHVDFDPASGHEMKGEHYCLVVSSEKFNGRFRLAMVCPISSGKAQMASAGGTLVSLDGFGLDVYGNVHIHQLTTIDYESRNAQLRAKAPAELVNEVLYRLLPILEE